LDYDEVNIKLDPKLQKKHGEGDIDEIIRIRRSYSPMKREMKQKIVDDLKITLGYPFIILDHCKLDINECIDIDRKWLGIKKRTCVKQLLRELD
jgi:hypothetical protein